MTSAVASALLASLIGIVGIVLATAQLRRERAAPPAESRPAEPPPSYQPQPYGPPLPPPAMSMPRAAREPAGPRSRLPLVAGIAVTAVLGAALGAILVTGGDGTPTSRPTTTPSQHDQRPTSNPRRNPSPPTRLPPTEEPSEPAVTVTVTAPAPASAPGGGDGGSAAWIAALGAVLAGLGTMASAVATFIHSPRRRDADH